MVRKAMRGERDPIITASFALGRTWPLLLACVFGSALIGNGVTGGWFIWETHDFVRSVFAVTAIACLVSAVCWNRRVLVLAMGIIMSTCVGRAWAIAGAYVDSRDVTAGGMTTLLVGSFIWIALALAEFVFTVALLTLVTVRHLQNRE